MKVELYTTKRCSLCDQAREMLVRAQARHGFAWEEHDIRDSPVLYERFRYDVPVVSVNGQVALKLRFTEDALESLFS